MKMSELIEKVSEVYRDECGKEYDLQTELLDIKQSLAEADETSGEKITLAKYTALTAREKELTREIELKKQYYEGISCVREMLMDLGFDSEIILKGES